MTHTFSPDGNASFFTNAAFENDVFASDACKRCYESNEQTVVSLFLDDDSAARVYDCVASVWMAAARDSGKLTPCKTMERVRLRRQHLGFIECTLCVWLLIRREIGYLSYTLELMPHTPIPAIEGHSTLASSYGPELLLVAEPTSESPFHDGLLAGKDGVQSLVDDDDIGMIEMFLFQRP